VSVLLRLYYIWIFKCNGMACTMCILVQDLLKVKHELDRVVVRIEMSLRVGFVGRLH